MTPDKVEAALDYFRNIDAVGASRRHEHLSVLTEALAEGERDAARLDWLILHQHISRQVVPEGKQISCPDGKPGCLVYHMRRLTADESRAKIDLAMKDADHDR